MKRKEAGNTPLHKNVIGLYGIQGSGKTGLAAGFPGNVHIDLERSLGDAHDTKTLDITTWSEFVSFADWVADPKTTTKDLGGDDVVFTVDTVAELFVRACKHHLAERKLKDWPDNDFGRLKDFIRDEFRETLDKLRRAVAEGKCGLILIAHEVERTRTDMMRGEVTSVMPDVGDYAVKQPTKGIDSYIAAKPQMVLRTMIAFHNPLDPSQRWPEGKWLTQANPMSEGTVVKDRSRRLPAYFGTSYEVMEREYKLGPDGRAKRAADATKANQTTKDN